MVGVSLFRTFTTVCFLANPLLGMIFSKAAALVARRPERARAMTATNNLIYRYQSIPIGENFLVAPHAVHDHHTPFQSLCISAKAAIPPMHILLKCCAQSGITPQRIPRAENPLCAVRVTPDCTQALQQGYAQGCMGLRLLHLHTSDDGVCVNLCKNLLFLLYKFILVNKYCHSINS